MTTTQKLKDTAVHIESVLNTEIGFSESKAVLLALSNIDTEVSWQVASRHGDVYEMLESNEASETARDYDAIGLITCGWAAPVRNNERDDIPPSCHPDRRRVRLFIVADNESRRVSIIRFQDNDETQVDDSTAKGTLADALASLFKAGK
jgi:hypothetical protein